MTMMIKLLYGVLVFFTCLHAQASFREKLGFAFSQIRTQAQDERVESIDPKNSTTLAAIALFAQQCDSKSRELLRQGRLSEINAVTIKYKAHTEDLQKYDVRKTSNCEAGDGDNIHIYTQIIQGSGPKEIEPRDEIAEWQNDAFTQCTKFGTRGEFAHIMHCVTKVPKQVLLKAMTEYYASIKE